MCELFGMSSRYPAVVTLSLGELAKHGGGTAHHKDGWGVAFIDGHDARVLRDPAPAAGSPLVQCVKENAFASTCVIAHVRKATVGEVCLRNTQPFQRELGGRVHVFAHNGHVPEVGSSVVLGTHYRPIGETDSEVVFCALLERLRTLWSDGEVPGLAHRMDVIVALAAELRELGPANFLYSDGDTLFAHGDKRTQADKSMRPPGLYTLSRSCPAPTVGGTVVVQSDSEQQLVTLIASVPLTDEDWKPMHQGEVLAVRLGSSTSSRQGA